MMTLTPSRTTNPATLTSPTAAEPFLPDFRAHGDADDHEWVTLPGGELEAPRPRVQTTSAVRGALGQRATTCLACRERRQGVSGAEASSPAAQPLCFACYRLGIERDLKLRAARDVHAASEAQFQVSLPFEPVNRARLNQLRAARSEARAAERSGPGRFTHRRRHAQIEARHALQRLAEGLKARGLVPGAGTRASARSAGAVRY